MSQEDEIRFLPYEEAVKIVAAIQEEEDIHRPDHHIFTVYNNDNKEICWFDFDEVIAAAAAKNKSEEKDAVSDYVLRHLPDWALDI